MGKPNKVKVNVAKVAKVKAENPIIGMIGEFPKREGEPVFKAGKNLMILYPGTKGKEYTTRQTEYLLWKYALEKNLDATVNGWDKSYFYANENWRKATGTEKVLHSAVPNLVKRMLSK